MQVNAKQVVITALLISHGMSVATCQAQDIFKGERPAMSFLEYLGGVESEVDGELSSPVELNIEAALLDENESASVHSKQPDMNEGGNNE